MLFAGQFFVRGWGSVHEVYVYQFKFDYGTQIIHSGVLAAMSANIIKSSLVRMLCISVDRRSFRRGTAGNSVVSW
jgi:hypothetical protein